jgi:hypothetical protein
MDFGKLIKTIYNLANGLKDILSGTLEALVIAEVDQSIGSSVKRGAIGLVESLCLQNGVRDFLNGVICDQSG